MGQVTLPIINRKGSSSPWEHNWDNKTIFTKQLNEDMFLKRFFKLFFKNFLSYQNYKFFKNYIKYKQKSKFIRFKKYKIVFYKKSKLQFFLKKTLNKKFTYNFSKLFLLRYKKWLLLHIYVYVPQVWIDKLEKKKTYRYNRTQIDSLYKHCTRKLYYLNNK